MHDILVLQPFISFVSPNGTKARGAPLEWARRAFPSRYELFSVSGVLLGPPFFDFSFGRGSGFGSLYHFVYQYERLFRELRNRLTSPLLSRRCRCCWITLGGMLVEFGAFRAEARRFVLVFCVGNFWSCPGEDAHDDGAKIDCCLSERYFQNRDLVARRGPSWATRSFPPSSRISRTTRCVRSTLDISIFIADIW